MAYTAIDNSRSVIQHYGKKGMKWRKNRDQADMQDYNPYRKLRDHKVKVDKMSSMRTKPQI